MGDGGGVLSIVDFITKVFSGYGPLSGMTLGGLRLIVYLFICGPHQNTKYARAGLNIGLRG